MSIPDYSSFVSSGSPTLKNVLIVDDNPMYVEYFIDPLRTRGHSVMDIVTNLADARRFVPQVRDGLWVALLDCRFPDSKGGRMGVNGPILAGELCRSNPDIGIFAYSDRWEGEWDDPTTGKRQGPHARLLGWDPIPIANLVDNWSIQKQREWEQLLDQYKEQQEQLWQRRKRGAER